MPTLIYSPRQERTGQTTRTPDLGGYIAPLNTFPPTTVFQHSFSFYNPNYLHILTETVKIPNLNSRKEGWQSPDIRLYVASFPCMSWWYQHPSLSCGQPSHWGFLQLLSPPVLWPFCMFLTPSKSPTYDAVIWIIFFVLNQSLGGPILETIVGLYPSKIPESCHPNRHILYRRNPP